MTVWQSVARRWRDDGTGNYRSPPHGEMYRQMMGSGYFTSLARSLFPPLIPKRQHSRMNSITLSRRWQSGSDKPPGTTWGQTSTAVAWPRDDVVPADESLRLQQALSETGGINC